MSNHGVFFRIFGNNRSRDWFVSRDVTAKVMDACPDSQWRLIVALCRFGGLRCPTEVLALTWEDIDWENKGFRVGSEKTEHHSGAGERMVPLFPELVEPLQDVFHVAGVGIETPSNSRVITRYQDVGQNLRTKLSRIIRRAGLKPWPKLFQNLRASKSTELVQRFPQHVAASWLGHSVKVALQHYWQVRESDFESAARCENVTQHDLETGLPGLTEKESPAFSQDLANQVAVTGVEPACP